MKRKAQSLGALAALGLAATAASVGPSTTDSADAETTPLIDRSAPTPIDSYESLTWDEALAEIRRRIAADLKPQTPDPKPEPTPTQTDNEPDEPLVTEPDSQDNLATIPWHGAHLADSLFPEIESTELEATQTLLEKRVRHFARQNKRSEAEVMDEAKSRFAAIQRSKMLPSELDAKLTLLSSGPEIAFQDAFDEGQFETAVRAAILATRTNPQALTDLLALFEKDLDTNAGFKTIDFGRALDKMPPYLRYNFLDLLTLALNEMTLNESQAGAINLIFDAIINSDKAG